MNVLQSSDDDIGMMAINDLFTGSGKTLTTMKSAIVFADRRKNEVIDRLPFLMREQTHGNWSTRLQCPLSGEHQRPLSKRPRYTNVIVVMCAKHLISRWKAACASAKAILGMNDDDVDVLENPLPGSFPGLVTEGGKLQIAIFHSCANLARLGLESVPVFIVDEFTVRSVTNVLTKPCKTMSLHGRLLLVSADAGSIKDIIHGAHRQTFLRRVIQWNDVASYVSDAYIAMAIDIPLISASVLPTEDRYKLGEFMINRLRRTTYERYVVKYTPSFASRLFGSNFEMSAVSGSRLFRERFGIVLSGSKNIGELLQAVRDTIATRVATEPTSRMIAPLVSLREKLCAFVGEREACPVCLEEYEMESGAMYYRRHHRARQSTPVFKSPE
ncbi:unnamed protein product [Ectocarpus sp. 8 AP-2014]